MAKARLVDVAKEAGVSPKTVSNYVNGYPFMTKATTERVRAAVEKLNYVPNRSAQTLRTGRIGIIGLVVPRVSTPYFAELASVMTEIAEEHGFTLLIDQTGASPERERRALAGLGPQALDGIIVSPLTLGDEDIQPATLPMVVLGERAHPVGIAYVGVDNEAASRAATDYLIGLGRRRIAAIGKVRGHAIGTGALRLAGYHAGLAAAGLEAPDELVPPVNEFLLPEGAAAMRTLLALDEPPDAVFCFSDVLAMGALAELHRAGVRVPEDMAIMGWDDIEEASFTWPALTTVRADTEAVARLAVEHLLRQIAAGGRRRGQTGDTEASDSYVDFTIVERASTTGRTD